MPPVTGMKCHVKAERDAMPGIVGGEDALAVVFKIQPFVRLISYHGLSHANPSLLDLQQSGP